MAIEIVDLPSYKMVDLSIVFFLCLSGQVYRKGIWVTIELRPGQAIFPSHGARAGLDQVMDRTSENLTPYYPLVI
jgi:hypothetical protein